MSLIEDWLATNQKYLKGMKGYTNMEKVLDVLKEQLDCPICRSPVKAPVQTSCGHLFCKFCLVEHTRTVPASCPLCKARVSSRGLNERNDAEDVQGVVTNLCNVYPPELEKFLDEKENSKGRRQKQKHHNSKPCSSELVRPSLQQKWQKKQNEESQSRSRSRSKEVLKPVSAVPVPSLQGRQKESGQVEERTVNLGRRNRKIMEREKKDAAPAVPTTSKALPSSGGWDIFKEFGLDLDPAPTFIAPLDLSLPTRNPRSVGCAYQPAIKFVKPLDLSMKKEKEKRKLQDQLGSQEDLIVAANSDRNKRSRFHVDDVSKLQKPSRIPAPTHIPLPTKGNSKRTPKEVEVVNIATDSAEKITSSDELLRNVPEYPVAVTVSKLNVRSQGQSQEKTSAKPKPASQKESNIVFKQPLSSPSGRVAQSQRRKDEGAKELPRKKAVQDVILLDPDEEFQQPRDSDLMFLDINTEGSQFTKKATTGSDCAKQRQAPPGKSQSQVEVVKKFSQLKQDADKKGSKKNDQKAQNPSVNSDSKKANIDKGKTYIVEDPLFGFGDDSDDEWMREAGTTPQVQEPAKTSKTIESTLPTSAANKAVEKGKETETAGNAQRRYVFCPSRLDKLQTPKLQELCKMCDGTISRDFSLDVTHLIINLSNGRVAQTFKYLQAIAGRKWVIIFDWVDTCIEKGEMVDEANFETSNFKQCDPGVKLARLSKTNLYEGFKFYFASDHLYKNLGFTSGEVMMLMQTLGAEVISSLDNFEGPLLIVGTPRGNETEYYNWLHTKHWITITFDWIIQCILHYELQPFLRPHLCIDATQKELLSVNCPESLKTVIANNQKSPAR